MPRILRFLVGSTVLLCLPAAGEDKTPRLIKGWGQAVDPEGDCKITLAGDKLAIRVPGSYHDLWAGGGKVNAPMVLQEVEGDFVVQVKVASAIRAEVGSVIGGLGSKVAFQSGCLLIWKDRDDFIRLDRGSMESGGRLFAICYLQAFKDGKRALDKETKKIIHKNTSLPDRLTHLRLERRQAKFSASYSQDDGKTWKVHPFGPFAMELPEKIKVGVAAINNTTRSVTVEFADLQIMRK